jgi:hypothetical protein
MSDRINDNNNDDGDNDDRTWMFVMIPVIFVFAVITVLAACCIRRRQRKRRPALDVESQPARTTGVGNQIRIRRAPPPQPEGLNELGEAPPPYPGNVKDDSDSDSDAELETTEVRTRPPTYVAPPPATAVPEGRPTTQE